MWRVPVVQINSPGAGKELGRYEHAVLVRALTPAAAWSAAQELPDALEESELVHYGTPVRAKGVTT
ncbi:hypothetical protein [Frankia sp. Cj3]|uniref:hypothetical protein n=1 Tax=Frankia sp. Cj3 TaxID=2880976 RepID=UPI001EF7021C|nr:hypothetical protein [Frankia sp. Cj3]